MAGTLSDLENMTLAQIAPDTTLGSETSIVKPLNSSVDQIEGGAIRGANLFHSFQEFNLGEGRGVYFTNPTGIENILSRVTGSEPSQILGKLGVVGGNANLFLINPNGIIFGKQASLDVRGSFLATTANAIQFSDRGFFSASDPNVSPVLTVNPSALLFNQLATGTITNNSITPAGQRLDSFAPSGFRDLLGLRVPDGRSLLLVGGNVSLDGGGLNALDGRVELAGVAETGTVRLEIDGNNFSLRLPPEVAKADISLTNQARIDTSGEGSGNIQVQGRQITLSSGSQIAADTLGSKSGGAIVLTASDSVTLIGFTRNGSLSTSTLGQGNAGDITLNTRNLVVRDGAQVSTSTLNEGSGGKLTVNASESVELLGTSPGGTPSSLFSATFAAGNAGNLTINTGKLTIKNGAQILTDASGLEDEFGNIQLSTGRGGDLTVNASNSVESSGTSRRGLPSSLSASTQGRGVGGDLKIVTGKLIVRNGAVVSVSSLEAGDAGNLQVQASSVRLETGGNLAATTETGRSGGNITLQNLDLLALRNGEISTSAEGEGNGGNINIDTDNLVLAQRSNIIARAVEGRGGNISITTKGLFVSPDSTIDATSDRGIDGVVEISRPDVDPSAELVILPADVVDVSGLVAQGCSVDDVAAGESSFAITGRGGLPPTPAEVTRSEPILADLGMTEKSKVNTSRFPTPSESSNKVNPAPLVEARGWVIGSNGEVVLTASVTTDTLNIPWIRPNSCNGT
jgi:filamentous hemagglutinin family protein